MSFNDYFPSIAVKSAAENNHVNPPKSTPTPSTSSVTTDVVRPPVVSGVRPVSGTESLSARCPMSEWAMSKLTPCQVDVQSRVDFPCQVDIQCHVIMQYKVLSPILR